MAKKHEPMTHSEGKIWERGYSREQVLEMMREPSDQEITVSLSQVIPIGDFGNVRLSIEISGLKSGETFESDLLRAVAAGGEALKVIDVELDHRLSEMTSPERPLDRSLLTERIARLESWQAVVRRNIQDIAGKVRKLREGHLGQTEAADPDA